MIRTRNFLLFILAVAFLLLGIILTVWSSFMNLSVTTPYDEVKFGGSSATMTAEVVVLEDGKQGRLEALRKKLASFDDVILSSFDSETDETVAVIEDVETATSTVETETVAVMTCANYHTVSPAILTGLLIYSEENGQRNFSVNEIVTPVGTSTLVQSVPRVVFTLPMRTVALDFNSCIATDVVAVTPTGLPIRNADFSKYRGSGEGTLIGYTLDGFPLFGQTSNLETDDCGGATVSGSYRYYLSLERESILNCFAGIPVAL